MKTIFLILTLLGSSAYANAPIIWSSRSGSPSALLLPGLLCFQDGSCQSTASSSAGSSFTIGGLDGGTPSGNGASASGMTLFMQSASSSNAGLVNTGTQTFSGAKTFSGLVTLGTSEQSLIEDTSGGERFNVNTGILFDPGSNHTSIDTANRTLNDGNGTDRINYGSGNIYDVSGNDSLHTSNREAINANGSTVFTWTNAGLAVSYATASTVPYLDSNRALQSSVVTPTELGYVSGVTSSLQTQLNGKQSTLTIGNLTDVGTDGIGVSGGTGAIIGSGAAISQHVSDTTHNGYLASADWNTFNGKQATVTIGSLDAQSENANGLAFVSNVLSAQSADSTHPGVVNNTTQTLSGSKTLTGELNLASGTITTNVPALNVTQTWNASGTTFDAPIFENITNTASNAASRLIDLEVGGSSKFSVSESGAGNFAGSLTASQMIFSTGGNISTGSNAFTLITAGALTTNSNQAMFFVQGNSTNTNNIEDDVYGGQNTFNPTSGSAAFTFLKVNPTINQTGGANGITRGIYISPTLTAAATWRAIETTIGNVIFGTGNVLINTAGYGLQVKTGSNAKSGHATCSGGSVAVSNTSVTANSHIQITIMTPGGTVTGPPWISSVTATSGFTITCSGSLDTSVIGYDIIEEI